MNLVKVVKTEIKWLDQVLAEMAFDVFREGQCIIKACFSIKMEEKQPIAYLTRIYDYILL